MFQKTHEITGNEVTIYIDGTPVVAEVGETVAAVLLRQRSLWSRTSLLSGEPRAPYCMMGVCFECIAIIDGAFSTQTCLITVCDGMRVERQLGCPRILV